MAGGSKPQVTRKPHYLPAGYLQFFSAEPKGRKSIVYLYDGTKSIPVTVESQCFERDFYSHDDERAR